MMFQRKPWLVTFGIFLTFTLLFSSCEKDPESQEINKEKVSGFVQKGPYINGTQILMAELNASMEQTGKLFTSQIINDRGSFEINNIELTSSFVEFSANGFYFDEVKGELSSAPLTLFALADITDLTTVNVNILTHLEKRRVEYLVGQNISFSQAKSTAQAEVLAIFGIVKENMQGSENLDISVNNDDNAILLAISLILQGNRSVADLTELLATISTDIREDGVFDNQSILNALRASTLNLNLSSIRQNLVARYNSLNVAANIPNFEAYIEVFLSMTAQEPVVQTMPATNVAPFSVTLNGVVNPGSALTNVVFEYGLDENFGNSVTAAESPVSGNTNRAVSAMITDLDPGSEYFFKVKAENDLGVTTGNQMSFVTHGQKPSAETIGASDVTTISAVLNGSVNPNYLVTSVVFEYGTSTSYGNTVTASPNSIEGTSSISVNAQVLGLQPDTEYFFRVKAENALGVTFSEERIFSTFSGLITDIEGNEYLTVAIGEQEWLARNLRTTKYSDGSSITRGPDNTNNAENYNQPAYYVYPHSLVEGINSDEAIVEAYGLLYNFYAVEDDRNICPAGWRVPSVEDWFALAEFLNPEIEVNEYGGWNAGQDASNSIRSTRTYPDLHPRWQQPNSGATNESLLSMLPSGMRGDEDSYFGLGQNFESSLTSSVFALQPDVVWLVIIHADSNDPFFVDGASFHNAFPVRCVKN